jgi:hypothetical protein
MSLISARVKTGSVPFEKNAPAISLAFWTSVTDPVSVRGEGEGEGVADGAGAVELDPHAVTIVAINAAAGIPQRDTGTPGDKLWAIRP